MLKKTQTILLFVLILCGVVLMGGIPTVKAQFLTVTEIGFDDQIFVTLGPDGNVIEACVILDPAFPDDCQPLLVATRGWITDEAPDLDGSVPPVPQSSAREILTATVGAATGSSIVWGGDFKAFWP